MNYNSPGRPESTRKFIDLVRPFLSALQPSSSHDSRREDGIVNMAAFLRGFEEKGLKNDRPADQSSKEKKKILFSFCDVCNIQLNSAAQAQVHYDGKSHRKRVKQLSDGQPPPPAPGSGPLLASPCPCPCPGTNTSTGRKQPRLATLPFLEKWFCYRKMKVLEQCIGYLKTTTTM